MGPDEEYTANVSLYEATFSRAGREFFFRPTTYSICGSRPTTSLTYQARLRRRLEWRRCCDAAAMHIVVMLAAARRGTNRPETASERGLKGRK
jgi:hypothetical protein